MPLHQELSNILGKPHNLGMHPPDCCVVGQREHVVTRRAALVSLKTICCSITFEAWLWRVGTVQASVPCFSVSVAGCVQL